MPSLPLLPPDIGYWVHSIYVRLPKSGAEHFLTRVTESKIRQDQSLYAKLVLWQLEDPVYGMNRLPAVWHDSSLRTFYKMLRELYHQESLGVPRQQKETQELFHQMESVWAVAGLRKKLITGFIAYRLSWIGGEKIADMLVRGWREAWVWGLTAARTRGSGQTDVLVWSFARAESKGTSVGYDKRMSALAEFFLRTCTV